jgi:hypothetical protein
MSHLRNRLSSGTHVSWGPHRRTPRVHAGFRLFDADRARQPGRQRMHLLVGGEGTGSVVLQDFGHGMTHYGIVLHCVIRGALLCLRVERTRRPSESMVSHLGNPGCIWERVYPPWGRLGANDSWLQERNP